MITKFLLILVWPAAIAVIVAVAAILTRTAPDAMLEARSSSAGTSDLSAPSNGRARPWGAAIRAWPWSALVRLGVALVIGGLLVYGIMALLGLLVVHNGGTIDHPIAKWTAAHQVHGWASVMKRLTKIGDTWTTWGAAAAAAVCLAVARGRNKWLPPVVLASVIVGDHFLTLAIRDTFHRHGPPASPTGSFPSGGCDRVILFYGTIAYLLWREYSGRRRTAIWAAAAVAALAFNEFYSRLYLTLHWFTDGLSGLAYGCLLLVVFVIAIRFADPPAAVAKPARDLPDLGGRPEEPVGRLPDYALG